MVPKQLLTISDIYIPNFHLPNPKGMVAEKINKNFARSIGLFDFIEDKKFHAGSSIGKFAFPYASLDALITCCQWVEWLFYIDDQFDEDDQLAGNRVKVIKLITEYMSLLRTGIANNSHPITVLCLSLRYKLLKLGNAEWFNQLCASTEQYLQIGVLGAVDVWRTGKPYTIEKYMHHREYDSGVYSCIDMVEIAENIHLSSDVRNNEKIQQLRKLATRHVAFSNDLFSYNKEVPKHANPNNLVHLFMYWKGFTFEESVNKVVEIINKDMATFLHIKGEVFTEIARRDSLEKYILGMECWMSGNIDWSVQTARYKTKAAISLR